MPGQTLMLRTHSPTAWPGSGLARPHLHWAGSWCIFGGREYDFEKMKGRKNHQNK
jgi:hypothetical protein